MTSTAGGERVPQLRPHSSDRNKEQRSACVASTAPCNLEKATAHAKRNGPPRREFTLSDHILLNAKPTARSNGHFSAKRALQQRQKPASAWPSARQTQQRMGTPASPDRPELGVELKKRLEKSSAATPTPARSSVARPSSAFGKATATAEVGRGGTVGGSQVTRGAGGHHRHNRQLSMASGARLISSNEEARKPGKQRLGPQKKKLSSLKKRVLLDRLEKWRQLAASQRPPSGASAALSSSVGGREDGGADGGRGSAAVGTAGAVASATSIPLPSSTGSCCCGGAAVGKPRCDGTLADERESGEGGNGGVGRSRSSRKHVVIIHHLVDEEDIEEDDDHAEVEQDLLEMASAFGSVLCVRVPRRPQQGAVGTARVAFATREAAERARGGLRGRVVGGKALEVEIFTSEYGGDNAGDGGVGLPANCRRCDGRLACVAEKEATGPAEESTAGLQTFGSAVSEPPDVEEFSEESDTNGTGVDGDTLSSGADAKHTAEDEVGKYQEEENVRGTLSFSRSLWRVVVRNLIDAEEDDLEDDDEYAEVRSDFAEIMGSYGRLIAVDIPKRVGGDTANEGGRVGEAIATFGSLSEAEACVRGVTGRRVGGKELETELVAIGSTSAERSVAGAGSRVEGDELPDRDLAASSLPPSAVPATGGESGASPSDPLLIGICAAIGPNMGRASWDGGGERSEQDECREGSSGARWCVVIRNLIEDEDNLEDDDEYAEVCSDVSSMTSAYGSVVSLSVPRAGGLVARSGADPDAVVAEFGSAQEAEACARGLHGRKVAGKDLHAEVVRASSSDVLNEETFRPRFAGDSSIAQPSKEGPPAVDHAVRAPESENKAPTTSPAGDETVSALAGASDTTTGGRGRDVCSVTACGTGVVSSGTSTAGGVISASTSAQQSGVGGKRMPEKYKEAAALPKPPSIGGGAPRAYVNHVRDGTCRLGTVMLVRDFCCVFCVCFVFVLFVCFLWALDR